MLTIELSFETEHEKRKDKNASEKAELFSEKKCVKENNKEREINSIEYNRVGREEEKKIEHKLITAIFTDK